MDRNKVCFTVFGTLYTFEQNKEKVLVAEMPSS